MRPDPGPMAHGAPMTVSKVFEARNDVIDDVEIFHESTKFGDGLMPKQQARIRAFLGNGEHFSRVRHGRKVFEFFPTTTLPEPRLVSSSIGESVRGRRSCRSFKDSALALQSFGDRSFSALGCLEAAPGSAPRSVPRRPYASAGGPYPIEPS